MYIYIQTYMYTHTNVYSLGSVPSACVLVCSLYMNRPCKYSRSALARCVCIYMSRP